MGISQGVSSGSFAQVQNLLGCDVGSWSAITQLKHARNVPLFYFTRTSCNEPTRMACQGIEC